MTAKEFLFTPFRRIAGGKALALGVFLMVVTSIIANFNHCHFDGAIDAHIGTSAPFYLYFLESFVSWILTAVVFFLTAKILSTSRFRWIDIAGTTALARYPCFFVALLAFALPDIQPSDLMNGGNISFGELNNLLLVVILMLVFSVWMIVLLYQAFTVSCNLKGSRAGWGFAIALLVAEIVSKVVLHYLYLCF